MYFPSYLWNGRSHLRAFVSSVSKTAPSSTYQDFLALAHRALQSRGGPGYAVSHVAEFVGELKVMQLYGQWVRDGRRLLVVEPLLAEALMDTDVGELRICDLTLPNGCTYFHFGAGSGIEFDGRDFEGAFVTVGSGRTYHDGGAPRENFGMRVALCGRTRPPLGDPLMEGWREVYDIPIHFDFFDLKADDAIKAAIERDLLDCEVARQRPGMEAMREAIDKMEARIRNNSAALQRAVYAIISTLAFMEAEPEDLAEQWQDDAPQRLVRQYDDATSESGRAKAASKLHGHGYGRVGILGKNFSRLYATTLSEPRGAVTPHMRRPHWRRQAHGPGMSQRKLLWIRQSWVSGRRAVQSGG